MTARIPFGDETAVYRLLIDRETLEFTGKELSFLATHERSSEECEMYSGAQRVLVNIIFNDQGLTRTDLNRSTRGEDDVIVAFIDQSCRSTVINHALNSPVFLL